MTLLRNSQESNYYNYILFISAADVISTEVVLSKMWQILVCCQLFNK